MGIIFIVALVTFPALLRSVLRLKRAEVTE